MPIILKQHTSLSRTLSSHDFVTTSDLCYHDVSSDEENDYDYEEEDNNPDFEEDRKCSQSVKKVTDSYITKYNEDNGRKPHSGFDNTYRRCLSHFFAWMGTYKRKYGKCIVEFFNNSIH